MKYIATWTVKHSAIIDAADDEEAEDKFTRSEYTGAEEELYEWDIKEACEVCKQPQDPDGRCGCVNKDAYGY